MKSASRLTSADMVLIAMYRASGGSVAKLPYEDIVIKAWQEFPETFSLRNHPEHPDGSEIHKRLYQALVSKGLAVSLGSKIFRLTDKGVERAKNLTEQPKGAASVGRIARTEELILRHIKGSRAYATWVRGTREEMVDYDARLFFQFGSGTNYEERRRRVDTVVAAVESAVQAGDPQARSLLELARYLRDKFSTLFQGEDDAS